MIDVYFTDAEDGCIIYVPPGIDEDIQLDEKPNGYGGSQLFFICPKCGARVRFLYWQDHPFPFVCRKCAGLNYQSQQKTKSAMLYYQKGVDYAKKYFELPPWGVDGFSFMDYLPERPRGMHKATYQRRLKRFLKYQEKYIMLTLREMQSALGTKFDLPGYGKLSK